MCLELEITESALAERPDEALNVLRNLKSLGLRLAVDDFGTGYSSLAHLKRFPIDLLKIDQSFIRDIPNSPDDMAISHAVIAMGQSMGMEVLAEGVETAAQLEFFASMAATFTKAICAASHCRVRNSHVCWSGSSTGSSKSLQAISTCDI